MVSLNLGQRKLHFLVMLLGVKGYMLWCLDTKSIKFVVSRDVTFDENFMLQLGKESFVDATSLGEEASKQAGGA